MPLNVAFQMDHIARIAIRGDSTFALMLEGERRGHALFHYTPNRLTMNDGRLSAAVEPVSVRDKDGDHFTLGAPATTDLSTFAVIHLRQDPPFDMGYITTTHLLERIHPQTLVVNDLFPRHRLAHDVSGCSQVCFVGRDKDQRITKTPLRSPTAQ